MRSCNNRVYIAPSINIAIKLAKSSYILGLYIQVLIIGSLFLVSRVLKLGL